MALIIEGKLEKLLPKQTGEGRNGPWTKQDFIVETFGEYPKKICFCAWNDKGKDLAAIPVGTPIKVSFSAESREYNERWYTDLKAYNIESAGLTNQPQQQPQAQVQQPQANVQNAKPQQETVEASEDDLPF